MLAVANGVSCTEWLEHKWKPNICANCKKPKSDHAFLASESQPAEPKRPASGSQVRERNPSQHHTTSRLTPMEFVEIQNSFSELDWNKDGTVDRTEFESYFSRHMYDLQDSVLDEFFSTLNGNNGFLSFGEFRLNYHQWKEKLAEIQRSKPEVYPWTFPVEVKQTISDHYELGDIIGEGGFGTVLRGYSLKTRQKYAIKTMPRMKFVDEDMFLALKREICILAKLKHVHICQLFEVFEEAEHFCLVMEFIEGKELFEYVKNRGYFRENDAKKILFQLINALDYLHSFGIIHQDLKPENILLIGERKDSMHLKLIDFGFATKLPPNEFCTNDLALGTPEYIAPELCVKGQRYNHGIDMWAVGVITYLMLSGLLPFSSDDEEELQMTIFAVEYDFDDPIWETVSETARNFIQKLLISDILLRMTARQCLEHPWLKGLSGPPPSPRHQHENL